MKTRTNEGIPTETIVVGVDGSPGSLQALRWAAEEARLRRARLHAVLAWDAPVKVTGGVWAIPNADELAEYGRRALERLRAVVDAHASECEGIDVEVSAVHGAASAVLLEAAREASQLVVGTRGHGGFVGLLLGSVSQQCTHHAPCPVVIVPPTARSGSSQAAR
jgi:nucleotide-binding universal stress UspA family protein